MRISKWAYISAVLLGTIGLTAVAALWQQQLILVAAVLFVAALTYPLGLLARPIELLLIYTGMLTPTEAIALCSLAYATLGYLQWYIVFPRFYRKGRHRKYKSQWG